MLLAQFVVDSTADVVADDGQVTLREALIAAVTNMPVAELPGGDPGLDEIRFNIAGPGPHSILIDIENGPLPSVTDPVRIDGYSQPGASRNTMPTGSDAVLLIEVVGTTGLADGLRIESAGSTVTGLSIYGFDHGIRAIGSTASDNLISGNLIGVSTSPGFAPGNRLTGVSIESAPANTIGGLDPGDRNVISGNSGNGVNIIGSASSANLVVGNHIGTDASGTVALGNSASGVVVDFASENTIGGEEPGGRNVISGNQVAGVVIRASGGPPTGGATGNLVLGNYLGTDSSGTVALGNGTNGVIVLSTSANTIGGASPGAGNLISGNAGEGILFAITNTSEFSNRNAVLGNFIGTNADGTEALGNGGDGIRLGVNVLDNTIGGASPGAGNLISGNSGDGIQVRARFGSLIGEATGNLISGNLIGTSASGLSPISNQGDGITLLEGATANTIGGTFGPGGNVVSANGSTFETPQVLQGPDPEMNDLIDIVATNLVGTFNEDLIVADRSGAVHIFEGDGTGNFTFAESVGLGSLSPVVLASTSGTVYVASGMAGDPLAVIRRNLGGSPSVVSLDIGFSRIDDLAVGDLDGDFLPDLIVSGDPAGLQGDGLYVLFAVDSTSFGAPVSLASGFIPSDVAFASLGFDPDISEQRRAVVALREDSDQLFLYRSNNDGTFAPAEVFETGEAPVALAIGDLTGDFRPEIVVANAGDNRITSLIQAADGSFFEGPSRDVGLNPSAVAIGDFDGDGLTDIASSNQSEATISLLKRLPNGMLREAEAVPVGLGPTSLATFSTFDPVDSSFRSTLAVLNEVSQSVTILNARQPRSGGIRIDSSPGNLVVGNLVGLGADGQTSLGNLGSGISVEDSAGTTIGGLSAQDINVISANEGSGIEILGPSSTGSAVLGNRIGTDSSGTMDRGNFKSGVRVVGEVFGTIVRGNLLSGNFDHGLFLDGEFDSEFSTPLAADQTIIQGNRIGTDITGTVRLANTVDGIHLRYSRNSTIGGTIEGQGNLVSGNVDHGIAVIGDPFLEDNASGNLILGNLVGTDLSGSTVLGNGEEGIYLVSASDNTIGGLDPGAANVISGNGDDGIALRAGSSESTPPPGSSGNLVQGNVIGTNLEGTEGLGNGQDDTVLAAGIFVADSPDNTISGNVFRNNIGRGMLISRSGSTGNQIIGNEVIGNTLAGIRVHNNASRNTIGGVMAGSGNVIQANGGNGVELAVGDDEGNPSLPPPFGIAILSNSIAENGGLGIDLGADGPTDNDPGDEDVGLNQFQNAPVLSSAEVVDGEEPQVVVSGVLDSTPGLSFRVEFFLTTPEADGFPEGRTFLGASLVTTDDVGLADISSVVPFPTDALGSIITATATDPEGNTSEFSNGVELPTDLNIAKEAPDRVPIGSGLTYTLTVSNLGYVDASGVAVLDPLPIGFQIVELTTSVGSAVESEGVVLVSIDALAPGESAVVTIEGLATALGMLENSATVSSETVDTDPENNTATTITEVFDPMPFVVLNTNDSGLNSLRQVILNANAFPGVDTITFRIPAELGTTIQPLSPLPPITEAVVIDGNSQPEGRVEVDGSLAGRSNGLVVQAGGTSIVGLTINQFLGSGVVLVGPGGNRVVGNVIGSDPSASLDRGNGDDGVTVVNSPDNTISGNVLSANRDNGVELFGPGSTGNVIAGNLVGTNGNGLLMLGNSNAGVLAVAGASDNTIGGPEPGDGNVLSANRTAGVVLLGPIPGRVGAGSEENDAAATSGNLVIGNTIGAASGAPGVLPNGLAGVLVSESAHNTIGGPSDGDRNIIAGGHAPGVYLVGEGARHNLVAGNAIGLRPSDSLPLGGTGSGVAIEYGAGSNTIGGPDPSLGNTIASNAAAGVLINASAFDNVVRGNTLGAFEQAPGNGVGLLVTGGAGRTLIQENRIGGNVYGLILDASSMSNLVVGNVIGDGEPGGLPGNVLDGLTIRNSTGNTVGGAGEGEGNLVSGNGSVGVFLQGPDASGNLITGNLVGARGGDSPSSPNGLVGIYVENAPGNTIGGSSPGSGNIASGNGVVEIQISGPLASGNLVSGNVVGVGPGGVEPGLAAGTGIFLEAAPGNTIGGSSPGSGNLVSGHEFAGIHLFSPGASGNLIQGNRIGTDADGVLPVGNEHGITIDDAPGNTIGGIEPGAGNLISGNALGVVIANPGAIGNVVLGNLVGTDASGTSRLPNRLGGVFLNGAPGNTIGGPTPESGNVISGNDGVGLQAFGPGASGNVIAGNLIGVDRATTTPVPNVDGGIFLNDSPGNTVGGLAGGPGNVVSSNLGSGVVIAGDLSVDNAVIGNVLGTPRPGDSPDLFGNDIGLFITSAPGSNLVGGGPDQENVIRGNRVTDTLIVGTGGPVVLDATATTDPSGSISAVLVSFSGPLDPSRASQPSNYRVNLGRAGNLGSIPIADAVYDDDARTVTLVLARPIPAGSTFRLVVLGQPPDGLTSRGGLSLDGDNDGIPGGNFVGILQGGRLLQQPGPLARPGAVSSDAVDALFGSGGLRVARRPG